jgi:regulator of sirC expression with transglutaminase-like and TPR domain
VRSPFQNSPEFRRLLEGARVDLPRVALEIASDAYPGLDIDAYLSRINDLASRVRQRCVTGAKPRAILGHLNWVLFVEEGFRGNESEYYDPRNSYLNEVLDRKTGIPISLSVLYAAVAAPLGLDLVGVNLPGHFVLALKGSEPALYVDAFHDGEILDRTACERLVAGVLGRPIVLDEHDLVPADATAIVARMLRNLKAIYLGLDDYASALPVARRLSAVDSDDMEALREWGLIALRSGHPGESLQPFSRYLEVRPDAEDAAAVTEILRTARRDVAQTN